MDVKLYTLAQARKILGRDVCIRNGHEFIRLAVENAAGLVVVDQYRCEHCDVRVTLSYPDDEHEQVDP